VHHDEPDVSRSTPRRTGVAGQVIRRGVVANRLPNWRTTVFAFTPGNPQGISLVGRFARRIAWTRYGPIHATHPLCCAASALVRAYEAGTGMFARITHLGEFA